MGTWRRHKGGFHARPRALSKASAHMVCVQCVLYPPACAAGRILDKAGILGRVSDTVDIAGRYLDMGEIVGRHFTILNALSVRMSPDNDSNVQISPDSDSNVQISPDSARRVRIPPDNARRVRMSLGIARPSRGAQRARKKFPLPYSVNGRKRRSARVAMRRARGILSHKSLDELSPNHIEHL